MHIGVKSFPSYARKIREIKGIDDMDIDVDVDIDIQIKLHIGMYDDTMHSYVYWFYPNSIFIRIS